jgi:hypothetical protein
MMIVPKKQRQHSLQMFFSWQQINQWFVVVQILEHSRFANYPKKEELHTKVQQFTIPKG